MGVFQVLSVPFLHLEEEKEELTWDGHAQQWQKGVERAMGLTGQGKDMHSDRGSKERKEWWDYLDNKMKHTTAEGARPEDGRERAGMVIGISM